MKQRRSVLRIAGALAAGAIVAAFIFGALRLALNGVFDPAFVVGVSAIWLAGIIVFVAPAWACMHVLGLRSLYHAILLSIVLGFVVPLGLFGDGFWTIGDLTSHDWRDLSVIAISSADGGAAVWYLA